MSRHRFFVHQPLQGSVGDVVAIPLAPEDEHHVVRVARIGLGEEVEIVDSGGSLCVVEIVSTQSGVSGRIVSRLRAVPDEDAEVILVPGVGKGTKVDDVVEAAVEIGVARVMPVLTERSVVRLDAEKRRVRGERWRRVALAAAKQSHRSSVPRVDDPVELEQLPPALCELDAVMVLWEDAEGGAPGLASAIERARAEHRPGAVRRRSWRCAVVVGPEGGLTGGEVDLLVQAGGVVCSLGPTILRAETAGIVAASIAVHALGGLGNTGSRDQRRG